MSSERFLYAIVVVDAPYGREGGPFFHGGAADFVPFFLSRFNDLLFTPPYLSSGDAGRVAVCGLVQIFFLPFRSRAVFF